MAEYFDRPYLRMDIEPYLNTPQMREYQLKKTKELLERLYHMPFWGSHLAKAKVKPGDIKTWEDFRNKVPTFEVKSAFLEMVNLCDGDIIKAMKIFNGSPTSDIVLMSATTGTTGPPTPYPFTSEGLDACTEWYARIMWRMGGRPGDRVAVCLALSMHIGGVPACYAITYKMGACPIPIGAEAGTERILRFLKMFKADALVCTPSLAEYLIEKAPQIIGADVKSLGLKAILAGGEPGAGIPEIRQRIEEAYGCTLYDAGAGLGGSCGYPEYQGMHWVMDDYAFIELVDPETKEPIPLEDGAEGEAVLTSFKGSFTGTLRMSFGDIAQIFVSPCPCGQSGLRYKITGRIDDMMKIKGEMVYPSLIDAVISEFIPRVTGEFRIILNQPLPRIEPPLKLKVEYGEGVKEDQLEALANEIKERMHSRLKVTPQIIWVPPNSMERAVMKKKFFEKTYEKK